MKHCFLVTFDFLLPFCVTWAFVCIQLDTGLKIFQSKSGQKVYHYFGGDKGVTANGYKVTK